MLSVKRAVALHRQDSMLIIEFIFNIKFIFKQKIYFWPAHLVIEVCYLKLLCNGLLSQNALRPKKALILQSGLSCTRILRVTNT
jgi:hypothetical protein